MIPSFIIILYVGRHYIYIIYMVLFNCQYYTRDESGFMDKKVKIARLLYRSLKDLFNVSKFFIFWSLTSIILLASIPVLQIYVTTRLINAIAELFKHRTTFINEVYLFIIFSCSLLFINQILNELNHVVNSKFQQKLNYTININIFNKTFNTPLELLEQSDYLNFQSRATSNGSRSLSLYITLITLVQNVMSLCGVLALLLKMHWMLSVVLLMVALPSFFTNLKISQKKYNLAFKQTIQQRILGYFSTLLSTRDVAKEFRIFSHYNYIRNKWSGHFWDNASEQHKLLKTATITKIALQFINFLTSVAALFTVVKTGILNQFSIGEYVAVSTAILSATSLLNNATNKAALLYEDAIKVNDYYSFLDTSVVIERKLPEDSTQYNSENYGILVNNLSFTYPNMSKPVLRNISFHIKKGEKIAIVGENGAGKSTLVKCLLGLYSYQEGSVYFDNIEVSSKHKEEIKVSAVFQDFTKYHLSIRENIGIGDVNKMKDDDLLDISSKKTGIYDYIIKTQHSYDTDLSTIYSKGHELSGGLWQRIALSRGFFKLYDFIVLDEPTSALDPLNEAEVYKRMIELSDNKTAIIITHRMGSCKLVDRILVLKNGILVEEGSHEQLMQINNGEYYRMYSAQSHLYS